LRSISTFAASLSLYVLPTSKIPGAVGQYQDICQNVYKMGLEHVGIVIGETFADFGKTYAHLITGQQDQGPFCQPYFITFPDNTNVKFYRRSLHDVCVLEGKRFDGFYHVIE
jgi:hypothetical protein